MKRTILVIIGAVVLTAILISVTRSLRSKNNQTVYFQPDNRTINTQIELSSTTPAIVQTSSEYTATREATSSDVFSIPPLPNTVNWIQETTQPHEATIYPPGSYGEKTSGSVTVPAQKWIASTSPTMGGLDPDSFWAPFEASLKSMGWSEYQIIISGKEINGPSADGRFGRQWSYLKRIGNYLYIIAPEYNGHVAGFEDVTDGEPPAYCPCSEDYGIIISGPIPLSKLGL